MHIESFDDKFIIYINKKIDLEDISGILLNYKNIINCCSGKANNKGYDCRYYKS